MADVVDPLTKDIANAFALDEGRPRLDDDALIAHSESIAALPAARKEIVAVELTALARRIVATGQDAWDEALVQLCLLVGVAVGNLERAGAMLADNADKAKALVGAAASHVPVGAAGRPAGSSSPLSALLANRSKKGPQT